jgi:hypothetical protein
MPPADGSLPGPKKAKAKNKGAKYKAASKRGE